jgi:hypothetical protein
MVALAFGIATINAASLYIQATTKSDLQKRIEILEADAAAQKRKNQATDLFLGAVAKEFGIKPE